MKKKVLLLLAGQARAFDNHYVVNGWKKFFDKYDVTCFACLWDNRGRSIFSIRSNFNDGLKEDEKLQIEDIQKVFPTDHIKLFNYDEWLNGNEFKDWMARFKSDGFFNCVFAAYYLRKKVFEFADAKVDVTSYHGVYLTRPDSFFIKELPDFPFNEPQFLWQQNSSQNFHPYRIYDNFLFGGHEVIRKLCNLYGSENMLPAIENRFNSNLHFLDSCKVVYSYCILENIKDKSYDYLYSEPFRINSDIQDHRRIYNNNENLWCE